MKIDWNKDNEDEARFSVNDGVETVYVSEDQLPVEFSMCEVAEAYASTYDHNGEDGWSVAQIVDLTDNETHKFAFNRAREFDWNTTAEGKYSPGEVIGTVKEVISGRPDESLICTSHAERANLTIRMSMRRFTRLTNAFSKKLENHRLACAVHFVHYNFARIHQSLRVTPAMEAGLTDHVWTLAEMVALLEAEEATALAA